MCMWATVNGLSGYSVTLISKYIFMLAKKRPWIEKGEVENSEGQKIW